MDSTKVVCPLTYRGYNYDFTTELYYLQSRYYCPEWGRFLNVDDTSILLASVGNAQDANLYAYYKLEEENLSFLLQHDNGNISLILDS